MCVYVSYEESSPDLYVNVERFRGPHAAMKNVKNAVTMPAMNISTRTRIRGIF